VPAQIAQSSLPATLSVSYGQKVTGGILKNSNFCNNADNANGLPDIFSHCNYLE